MPIKQAVKALVLPRDVKPRRLPLGIGRGLVLEVDFRHWTLLYFGLYEIEMNKHLRRLCDPGDKVFDVGGQLGYDALIFARLVGSQGRVISFECESLEVQGMRRNFASNPNLAPRLQAVEAFVGHESKDALQLDVAARNYGMPDVVKLDIEGAEVDALRGARTLLAQGCKFLIEVHGLDRERECLDILREYRYRVITVNPRRWLPDNRPMSHNRWLVATP